jgi:hypothetical protein
LDIPNPTPKELKISFPLQLDTREKAVRALVIAGGIHSHGENRNQNRNQNRSASRIPTMGANTIPRLAIGNTLPKQMETPTHANAITKPRKIIKGLSLFGMVTAVNNAAPNTAFTGRRQRRKVGKMMFLENLSCFGVLLLFGYIFGWFVVQAWKDRGLAEIPQPEPSAPITDRDRWCRANGIGDMERAYSEICCHNGRWGRIYLMMGRGELIAYDDQFKDGS